VAIMGMASIGEVAGEVSLHYSIHSVRVQTPSRLLAFPWESAQAFLARCIAAYPTEHPLVTQFQGSRRLKARGSNRPGRPSIRARGDRGLGCAGWRGRSAAWDQRACAARTGGVKGEALDAARQLRRAAPEQMANAVRENLDGFVEGIGRNDGSGDQREQLRYEDLPPVDTAEPPTRPL
jgi:hypothetical protein